MFRFNVTLAAAAICALTLSPAAAQDSGRATFGGMSPFTVEDLPPGILKNGLQALPPQARQKAIENLNKTSFPASDAEQLRVDSTGGVFYVDALPLETGDVAPVPAASLAIGIGAEEVFALHSKPGSPNVIYLDVDGHVIRRTAWNDEDDMPDTLVARPFDSDGNEAEFSATELNQIAEIWHRVAEDFAMFDIDVTTEKPSKLSSTTVHVVITPNTDANGVFMPDGGAGGIAYYNKFGDRDFGFYSPALVYSSNVNNIQRFIAETASHEAGHNLGLSHDGAFGRGAYYSGHGSGLTKWSPIMGLSFSGNVTQWSRGEYDSANNIQDDIAIIAGKTGVRSDDHADNLSAATPLSIENGGQVLSTNPETDVFNANTANKGIIETREDIDMFSFQSGDGPVSLTVTPAWAAWFRESEGRGANLDVEMTVYDADGNIVVSADPIDDTNASISMSLVAGNYYLGVRGVGNSLTPYTDYGSQGQYFITGTVTPGDGQPPVGPALPAAATDLNALNNEDGNATITWTDTQNDVSYAVIRERWNSKRRRWVETTQVASVAAGSTSTSVIDASGAGLYRYLVRSSNTNGNIDSIWVEVTVTEPSSGNCKGGPKKCG